MLQTPVVKYWMWALPPAQKKKSQSEHGDMQIFVLFSLNCLFRFLRSVVSLVLVLIVVWLTFLNIDDFAG